MCSWLGIEKEKMNETNKAIFIGYFIFILNFYKSFMYLFVVSFKTYSKCRRKTGSTLES